MSKFENMHPSFAAVLPDYVVMGDCYAGERAIKSAGTRYLPPTAGMILDGLGRSRPASAAGVSDIPVGAVLPSRLDTDGDSAFGSYIQRAVFPEVTREAVETLVGVLHREPATFELPGPMSGLIENATTDGQGLQALLRRVNEQQLVYGRVGLLADVSERRETPFLVEYAASTITNWKEEAQVSTDAPKVLSWLVLDESGSELDPETFEWAEVARFRTLFVGPTDSPFANGAEFLVSGQDAVYRTALEVAGQMEPGVAPSFKGRTLSGIPFVVIGANDLSVAPDTIPLLPIAQRALAIYRTSADYRQALHLQGQDTLVVIGGDGGSADDEDGPTEQATRVGAGAKITVPTNGDAKFIGVSSAGLDHQAKCIESDEEKARELGAKILTPPGSQAESGDALGKRISAQTASLYQIALTGAAGLERALRIVAEWMGLDPSQVRVKPNLRFADVQPDPRNLGDLMDAKEKGAPLSVASVHAWAREKGFTRLSFEEEQALLQKEEAEAKAKAEKEAAEREARGEPDPEETDSEGDPNATPERNQNPQQ